MKLRRWTSSQRRAFGIAQMAAAALMLLCLLVGGPVATTGFGLLMTATILSWGWEAIQRRLERAELREQANG